MININLQIPSSNKIGYAIKFHQNKQMSELFDWIYDNFNQFFKGDNKNKLELNNKNKRQTFRSSNQLVSSCISEKDVLEINEVESEISFLSFCLQSEFKNLNVKIQDDITIQELIDFVYSNFDIPLDIKIEMIYENQNLFNLSRIQKLANLNVENGATIKIKPLYPLDNNLINLQLICKDNGKSWRYQFQKSDILNTVINSAYNCLGLDENSVGFSIVIKSRNYKGDANKDRYKTLSSLKLEDDDIIEVRILYSGG
ncbi:unnamed protein product [Paramecium octaurelia]|uniref:Ubiquitin-like domain-containing protein n=1 Tax=Paramecium octaurelia TaxID=43137 RepID=A0A8S1SIN9_PAROT|nr:unnamed protein product [Paramecium octaurelia]